MKNMPSQTSRYGIAVLLVFVIAAAWIPLIDGRAETIVTDSFKRATVTFASARALNAIVSLAKGTEVTVGIGAMTTFSLGEVLDPIDDLVEQFGDLMLMATVSLGIQKILLIVAKSVIVKATLTLVLIAWVVLNVTDKRVPRLLTGLLILTVMARFAIPVVAVGTHEMFQLYLSDNYRASTLGIESETAKIEGEASWWNRLTKNGAEKVQQRQAPDTSTSAPQEMPDEDPKVPVEPPWWKDWAEKLGLGDASSSAPALSNAGSAAVTDESTSVQTTSDGSAWERVKGLFGAPKILSTLREKMDVLRQSVELTAGHIIDLIVVFLLETLLIPLAILWLLYAGLKSILSPSSTRNLNRLIEAVMRESKVRDATAPQGTPNRG